MLRDVVDELHGHEELPELPNRQWLRVHFVHSAVDGSLNVFVLNMAGDGHDLGLLVSGDVYALEHLSDPYGCLVSVHERHVAVHQDQRVFVVVAFADALLYDLNSLLSVVGEFRKLLSLVEAQDHKEALYYVAVELLVVDHENFAHVGDLPVVALH